METVTLKRQTNGWAWSKVRVLRYFYYDGVEFFGNLSDLKLAVLEDGNGNVLDRRYQRYYTVAEGGGYQGALTSTFGAQAYARLLAAFGNPEMVNDAAIEPDAEHYLQSV